MSKANIFQRPGILLGTFATLILVIGLAILKLTMLERAVLMIVCLVAMVGGVLFDAGAFNRFINKESESPDW